MALRIVQRASITPEFIEFERQIYRAYLRREKQQAEMYPAGAQAYLRKRAPAHTHALSVIRTDRSDDREGAEFEMTRLRALSYDTFTTLEHHHPYDFTPRVDQYLVGLTKPIVLFNPRNNLYHHMGQYAVYLPLASLERGSTNRYHFIPIRAPRCHYRHPHHVADFSDDVQHPLDFRDRTCWGEFPGVIRGLLDGLDIPELFRVIYLYLSRYNEHSPLMPLRDLDWDTQPTEKP